MMDWIKTCDGYIRKDAIIDVHINQTYPGAVYVVLINGDSVKMADFGNDAESAEFYLSELMRVLVGGRYSDVVSTLP